MWKRGYRRGKLTVTKHNGAYLTLIPQTELSNVLSVKSQEMKINKKPINVNINDVTAIYGDNPTVDFSFTYNDSDLLMVKHKTVLSLKII